MLYQRPQIVQSGSDSSLLSNLSASSATPTFASLKSIASSTDSTKSSTKKAVFYLYEEDCDSDDETDNKATFSVSVVQHKKKDTARTPTPTKNEKKFGSSNTELKKTDKVMDFGVFQTMCHSAASRNGTSSQAPSSPNM